MTPTIPEHLKDALYNASWAAFAFALFRFFLGIMLGIVEQFPAWTIVAMLVGLAVLVTLGLGVEAAAKDGARAWQSLVCAVLLLVELVYWLVKIVPLALLFPIWASAPLLVMIVSFAGWCGRRYWKAVRAAHAIQSSWQGSGHAA